MQIVVIADTHLLGGIDRLPRQLLTEMANSDAVIHAGDIVSQQALAELRELCPLHSVLGNNDLGLEGELPETALVDLAGVTVAIIHDSGRSAGRAERLARRFPSAQLVVFGHSHVPVDDSGAGGQRLFNPGSPTQRRRQPFASYGRLNLEEGAVGEHRIVKMPR